MRSAFSLVILCVLLCYPNNVCSQCDASQPLALTATEFPQYLTSPGYDGTTDYAPDLSCSWIVTSSVADQQLVLNIGPFEVDVSSDNNCNKDFIDIFDGADNEATQITHMCRRNVSQGEEIGPYVSTGDTFYLLFVSDGDNEVGYGFNILYFSITPGSQPDCGGPPIAVTTTQQVLMSPNLPDKYTANFACEWLFSVTTGILSFKVKFVDMETSNGGTCPYDFLKIYDGDTSATKLLEICQLGQDAITDGDVNTTGNGATVSFGTDTSNHYYGFMLTIEAIEDTTTTTTTTSTTTTTLAPTTCSSTGVTLSASTTAGAMQSPNYGTSYETNLLCKWILQANTNYALEVQFDTTGGFGIEDSTYCSYDYVSLYDGDSTTSTLINTFCGTTVTSSAYRSSGTNMLVVFKTDYSINDIGFKLRYTAVLNTPAACDSSYTRLPAIYDTSSGYNTITSTSHPSNYASNLEEYWVLDNSDTVQYKIILNFTALDVERSTGCVYDRITVYDGSCIKDNTLYLICGTTLNWYELTGSAHLIHFHTDGSVNKGGFSLQYYVVAVATQLAVVTTTTTLGPPVEAVIETMNEVLTNYSKDLLPSRDLSAPIQANVDFFLVAINGLDSVEQKLTTTGQFDVIWTDGLLSWVPAKKYDIVRMLIPQDDLWRPDVALMNGFTTISAMGASFMFIDVLYNGTCTWRPYQILESACQVDMTYYPYDRQRCLLQFGMWSSSDSDVVTKLGQNGLQMHSSFQQSADWELISTETVITNSSSQQTVNFYLTLQRNPAYVTFYMTLPVVMLAYINTFTFAIPCESGEKSGFAVTVFLSFTVFVVVIQGSIPANSDSVSLFGAYVITVTIMSAFAVMVTILELRAISLNADIYPVARKVKRLVKFISKIRGKISCTKQKAAGDKVKLLSTEGKDDVSLSSVKNEAYISDKPTEARKRVTFQRTDTVDSMMFPKHKNLTVKREVTTSSIALIKEDTTYFDAANPPEKPEEPLHTNGGRKESLINSKDPDAHESAGTLKLHRQITTASITVMKENTLIYDNDDVEDTTLLDAVLGSYPPTDTVLLQESKQATFINDAAPLSSSLGNVNQTTSESEVQSASVPNSDHRSKSPLHNDKRSPETTIEQFPENAETTHNPSVAVTESQISSTDTLENQVTSTEATSRNAIENQATSTEATSRNAIENQATSTEVRNNEATSTDAMESQASSVDRPTTGNQATSSDDTDSQPPPTGTIKNQTTSIDIPENWTPQHDSNKRETENVSNSNNVKSDQNNCDNLKPDDKASTTADADNPWKELVAAIDFVLFILFLLLTTLFTLTFLLELKYN